MLRPGTPITWLDIEGKPRFGVILGVTHLGYSVLPSGGNRRRLVQPESATPDWDS